MNGEVNANSNGLPNAKHLELRVRPLYLTWGCLKIGESFKKEFILENTSNNPLTVKITSYTTQFMLVEGPDDSDVRNFIEILLQPSQPQYVGVNFCPSTKGASMGVLVFTSADAHPQPGVNQKHFHMYGCGGYVELAYHFENIFAQYVHNMRVIDLGDLSSSSSPLLKHIAFKNGGDLPAFIYATFRPHCFPFKIPLDIHQQKFFIGAKEIRPVILRYLPQQDDSNYFKKHIETVYELGVLTIYTGPEFLRRRLRRIVYEATQTGRYVDNVLREIASYFPSEHFYDSDLFNEPTSCIMQLLGQVYAQEVLVQIKCGSNS